jgi:hypothetical protein
MLTDQAVLHSGVTDICTVSYPMSLIFTVVIQKPPTFLPRGKAKLEMDLRAPAVLLSRYC